MATAIANGITIEYESLGDPAAPAVLLIMGLGMQLVAWPDPFCEKLVQSGFRVIRYDNRDVGLSQKFDELGTPRMGRLILRSMLGLDVRSAYSLDDMAGDAVGLLDALGVGKAHVVGASMGGMIAQQIAVLYPERVLSLTSIMSTTGARHLPRARARVLRALAHRPPDASVLEAVVDHYVMLFGVIGSPGYPTPAEPFREHLRRSVERSYRPAGTARQLAAIMAAGDRSSMLARISCPTLVIHGKSDPLVPYQGGVDTALKIRDARLVLLDGFGHDFPPQLLDRLAGMIVAHAHESAA